MSLLFGMSNANRVEGEREENEIQRARVNLEVLVNLFEFFYFTFLLHP